MALGLLLLAMAASAQSVPWRLLQGADGGLWLVVDGARHRVQPVPATDDELAAIPEAEAWDGQALGPPLSERPAAPVSGKAAPIGNDCPPTHPIKGNQGSRSTTTWIYHVPGGASYAATIPEECFATEADAQAAGYRRALR